MRQFIAFVIKETKHILRDKRTMLILFGMPVVMMLLFGFAITTDVKNVRTVVVTSEMSPRTQQAVERLAQSEYFVITQTVNTPQEAELLIRSQKADMALVFAQNRGVQIMVDGSDPNMAQQWTTYAQQTIASAHSAPASNSHLSLLTSHLLYNPQMKSAYNFVPAIMGMLLMLICAMMTSISIVREKEKGTMEVLLVSPVRPLMVIIAKAVPYLVECTAGWFVVLDSCREHALYSAGALAGTAYLQCCANTTRGPADVGYGTAYACGDAFRYAVPCRINAHHPAMDICHCAASLLYPGHAQADDYGCWYRRCGARGSCAGRYDSGAVSHCAEEV